jgi:hypothetical protein
VRLPTVVRRLLRGVRRRLRADRPGEPAAPHAGAGHVRVVDATDLPPRSARPLARRLATGAVDPVARAPEDGAPRIVVLATPRSGAIYARAGLTVETAADRAARDRALVRYGAERTVHLVPLGRQGPIAVAPVRVVAPGGPVPDVTAGPVFIGGTGRSGSWALGRLLGEQPARVTVHTELRFHAHKRAFARMLDGSLTPASYSEHFLERYHGLTSQDGTAKGLQLIASRWEVTKALRTFRTEARADLPAALGQLVRRLVDPYARARYAAGWIETTPPNAAAADALTVCLPDAHVIHIVRDGRDVAASVATMAWGPDDPLAALDRWAAGLRAADAAFRAADPARVHVVRFEDLAIRDRERTLTDLLDRLGVTDRERVLAGFDRQIDPRRSNTGRWRRDAGADAEAAIDARYRVVLAELAEEGVACLPVPPDELAAVHVETPR